jgi:hypothetical protein
MKAALLLVLPLVLLPGGDEFAAGVRAYREGRFREAFEAFSAAETAAGYEASAALLFNRALAALHVGELRVAEISAEKAAVRGGAEFEGIRDFVFANAAFLRCARAEAEADLMDADPTALRRAIVNAESALDLWRRAATSRDDWPEARRNVERAVLKLEELKRKHEEAEKNRKTRKEKGPEPEPEPEPERDPESDDPEEVEQDPVPQQEPGALSPEELTALLDTLVRKEREKRALRRARQRVRTIDVENDW